MKSRILLALVVGSAVLLTHSLVTADDAAPKFQAKCPVSGAAAKADKTADFKGGKVQFCCENCPKAFAANPDKFAAKAAAQMIGTGEMKQVACPYSGQPCNPDTKIAVADGVSVAFCCEKCQAKTEKADDKVAMVFANLSKGFTTQTKCPVSGKAIDPKQTVDYKGEKVYFCCPNCPAAFEKDPTKFTAKLPQLSEKK